VTLSSLLSKMKCPAMLPGSTQRLKMPQNSELYLCTRREQTNVPSRRATLGQDEQGEGERGGPASRPLIRLEEAGREEETNPFC